MQPGQQHNYKKCVHCGQLILRIISKIGATRCQVLRLKCTKFDFCWGSALNPAGAVYSAPPDIVAVFKGLTSRGKKGEGEEKAGKGCSQLAWSLDPPLEEESEGEKDKDRSLGWGIQTLFSTLSTDKSESTILHT